MLRFLIFIINSAFFSCCKVTFTYDIFANYSEGFMLNSVYASNTHIIGTLQTDSQNYALQIYFPVNDTLNNALTFSLNSTIVNADHLVRSFPTNTFVNSSGSLSF